MTIADMWQEHQRDLRRILLERVKRPGGKYPSMGELCMGSFYAGAAAILEELEVNTPQSKRFFDELKTLRREDVLK
jgi:hypothetical protein